MRRPLLLSAVVDRPAGGVARGHRAAAGGARARPPGRRGGRPRGRGHRGRQVTPEAIDRSVEIIRNRVDAFGVAEPEIQTQGNDQIVVALPGADNPEQVVNDLIQPAQLVFINFEANVVDQAGTAEDP